MNKTLIEHMLSESFTVFGLTSADYLIMIFTISASMLFLGGLYVLVVNGFVFTCLLLLNKFARPFFMQSLIIWHILELKKQMTIQQSKPLPRLFEDEPEQ